ncbi:MAG: hotdog fold thioesterase, partial [Sphingobacteriales bacterium]|nr:hotdog fold thioesterase [Sphingobacteriales bacterium]
MPIWFNKSLQLEDLRVFTGTMAEYLGMQWVELGDDFLRISMPVDERTKQPYGLLHGGASCALAETVGSVAAQLVIDPAKYVCVGLEINANHVRSARQGLVTAIARPIHIGGTTQVWDIRIYDEKEKLVCISRLTVAVLKQAQ